MTISATQGHTYTLDGRKVMAMESGAHPEIHAVNHLKPWPLTYIGRVKFRLPGGGLAGPAGAPSVLIAYGKENLSALKLSGIAGYAVDLQNDTAQSPKDLFSEAA